MLGYVDDDDLFFEIKFFSRLSRPGGIFEKGTIFAMIPSLLQVVAMVVINKLYIPLAVYCTNRENHKT